MAYVSQELKKKLSPSIKEVLKKYGMKGTIAVNNHSTLVVNLKSGSIDFKQDSNSDNYHYQVNPYWYHEHFSGKAKSFLIELFGAMKPADVWYDNTDAMIDYFDTAYYVDVNVGQWNKEYQVV
jgi:hypothetical protein